MYVYIIYICIYIYTFVYDMRLMLQVYEIYYNILH